jgi:2-polyprenyl-3-methyl-5-hydroxy-6-metoxy-1,4-benzoquinol methylase
MKALSDEKIVESWKKNVHPWIAAIRNGEITSRVQTTNQAILKAVLSYTPKTVLDIGCGEGWLVRELAKNGIDTLGVDAVRQLIESAKSESTKGRYQTLSYEEISIDTLKAKYDIVVSNFSLLGNESVSNLFQKISSILVNGGHFIVQTIHPITGSGKEEYKDGWRVGNWDGFNEMFTDPAPWYFRTMESWKALYEKNGFYLERIEEPNSKLTGTATSIIFIGKAVPEK